MTDLEEKAYSTTEHTVHTRMIDMYYGDVDTAGETRMLESFIGDSSPLRCMVCSVAFGMGVDIPNIETVIHWGTSHSLASYWQEAGRGGRDGKPSKSIVYMFNSKAEVSVAMCSLDAQALLGKLKTNDCVCIRYEVLKVFLLRGMPDDYLKRMQERTCECSTNLSCLQCAKCSCCSSCKMNCEKK